MGAPDVPERPWLTPAYPEVREGPPWVMSDMVVRQRELPGPILADPVAAELAGAIRRARAAGAPVVVTGCGTSEHAAQAVAAVLAEATAGAGLPGGVVVRTAFEAALEPERSGLCVAVSHGGTSTATVAALRAAREAGAVTCLITAAETSEAHADAELVYRTPIVDASWCHTVAYLSPILAAAAVAMHLAGTQTDPEALTTLLAACDGALEGVEVAGLAGAARLLVTGSGVDEITASEQTLKIEEGAWIPTVTRHVETLLHGHLPGIDEHSGLIAYVLDPRRRPERAQRMAQALRAARAVGATCLLVTDGELAALPGDVETVTLPPLEVPGVLGALAAGAIALQRLTLALADLRGTNPDLLRRDDVRYRTAALLGEHKLRMFAPPP